MQIQNTNSNSGFKKPKVNVLTIHFGINHGSVLQCYALCKTLETFGAVVEVIDYVPPRYKMWENVKIKYPNMPSIWKLAYFVASSIIRFPQKVIFRNYLKRHLNLTIRYPTAESLKSNPPKADLYLVGSDQVWNSTYNGSDDKSYMLEFVPEGKQKASYAASIGKNELVEQEGKSLASGIADYVGVSVREVGAQKLLAEYEVSARVDLDPVFLLDVNQWRKLANNHKIQKPYVLVYVIAQNYETMIQQAREIADRLGAQLFVLSVRPIHSIGVDHNYIFSNPSDFLGLFQNACFVISNSFHGTAFSIIFQKQFLTYSAKYNSRIENILAFTELEDRLVKDRFTKNQFEKRIDYADVKARIEEKVEEDKSFLADLVKGIK